VLDSGAEHRTRDIGGTGTTTDFTTAMFARHCAAGRGRTTEQSRIFVTHFRAGLDHFNATEFWDAHESWETIWLEAESEVHRFLQGLISWRPRITTLKRGTYPGRTSAFRCRAGEGWRISQNGGAASIGPWSKRWPGVTESGFATLLVQGSTGERLNVDDFPQIATDDSPMPPFERW